ncbi:ACP S-malonyltransferase [Bythopirellula polymerisocia]|uniref:[acyl-carrier-protein] S-malonyltransferase n=1 Tax=Bythopirellula polymerisocia TaxID=2528003 RepID=A0A5C6CHW5_9BACT|nr:ACP S-malonyltransferase [Bythopirellula polymerisocia]TWU22816.1 Malonyl CoA-acyl carrier protein transacylase [Bythopirellula polymerisocia]
MSNIKPKIMALSQRVDLSNTALAFRGYSATNLGRTAELLAVDAYRGILTEELKRYADICAEMLGEPVDLLERINSANEFGVDHYSESIALIAAVEVAHLRLLREVHNIDIARVGLSFGYSLGELVSVSCAGVFDPADMIRVPLAMAADSVALSADVTMGVLFSRGPKINQIDVERLCHQITSEGAGTIAISAMLSPNTYLLLGQRDTTTRFKEVMRELLPYRAQLRTNDLRWPPLHTPIVRQRQIPDRAAVMMETLAGGFLPPNPPVLSLVTGKLSYNDHSAREILRQWIDQPQRLWDAIDYCLAIGIERVIHVGPEPNVIPATFHRLSENILEQTNCNSLSCYSLKAVTQLARRPWLSGMLPGRANLLRAPYVEHIILEDWLIENSPQ